MSNLRAVEKKVLGAMLILCNDEMVMQGTMKDLAKVMGYKAVGGAITFAIQALEMKNYISIEDRKYTVLI